MVYFPVDDQMAFHPKIVAAGNAAVGMWTRAGAWCKAHTQGGFVPDEMVGPLGGRTSARRLVTVGLWEAVGGGYRFHDWAAQAGNFDAEKEKALKEAERERWRLRKQRQREREKGSHGVTPGVTSRVTSAVTPVTPIPIPLTTDTETPSVPQMAVTDEDEGIIRARSAALAGLGITDFGRVKAAVVRASGRDVTDAQAMVIVADILSRAVEKVEKPQAYVLTSIRSSWAEIQKHIDEEAV